MKDTFYGWQPGYLCICFLFLYLPFVSLQSATANTLYIQKNSSSETAAFSRLSKKQPWQWFVWSTSPSVGVMPNTLKAPMLSWRILTKILQSSAGSSLKKEICILTLERKLWFIPFSTCLPTWMNPHLILLPCQLKQWMEDTHCNCDLYFCATSLQQNNTFSK